MTGALPVAGIKLAAASAGIYDGARLDLALIEVPVKATVAAVFTQNSFAAAPVKLAAQHLGDHSPRLLVINSGNANAGTGDRGITDAQAVCVALARLYNCAPERVLPFSTGVIGEYLPVERIIASLAKLLEELREDAWLDAAQAIMTTDSRPKWASQVVRLGDTTVTVTGIAKGSGMIAPNMATMLAFIATDAALAKGAAEKLLGRAVENSFNCISVDGDTSTNDACVLIGTGHAKDTRITDLDSTAGVALSAAVCDTARQLSEQIIRDGEGATKFVTIEVQGGKSRAECLQVARTIADSPLVKTALTASDPNWGRILAAVGNAGIADISIDQVDLFIGGFAVASGGGPAIGYDESLVKQHMQQTDIDIRIALGRGVCSARFYTCDLSQEYVSINADYRT